MSEFPSPLYRVINNNLSNTYWTGGYYGNGVLLIYDSDRNNITENNIINNSNFGILIYDSSNDNNSIYHNNLDNTKNTNDSGINNYWDNGYPDGGNYWSDYTGTDSNSDGIGDTPYIISTVTQDNYPLMALYNGTPLPPPTNHPPNQPLDLKQLKSDGSTEITIGGTTNERTVIFKSTVSDPDGDQVRLEVELRRTDENNGQFDENLGGTKLSPLVANGSIATASAVELNNGQYHWRVRTVDANGNKSEWADYGGNLVSEVDFTVSVSEFQNFNLSVIADPHLGYYLEPIWDFGISSGMENSVTSFTDKLQEIKSQKVEQIVVPGDLVQDSRSEFFTAFKNLVRGFNVSATPGNHDRRTLFWGNDLTNYQNIINPKLDWNFSYNGINIVGLNSGGDYNVAPIPECDFLSLNCLTNIKKLGKMSTPESDGLNDSQWSKLNAGEFSPVGQRQIITMHSPVISANNDSYEEDQIDPLLPDGGSGGNNAAIAHYRADVINYAINNLVEAVLGGHTHQDGIYNATGIEVKNTSADRPLFIQTRNDGYRIVEVKDGKVNPFETKTPEVKNRKSSSLSISHGDTSGLSAQYGLHAYDSQNRHTGMVSCTDEFELGIPNSYYTGNYLGMSSVPEVLVGYSDMDISTRITEFKIFSIICLPNGRSGASTASVQSLENITFNQTVTDQTNTSTTETVFTNVTLEENSSAIVNVTNMTAYKMEVDLTSDGIVDQVVIPDSVSTANVQPQQNISIVPYSGTGTINISVSLGNITSAGNMNVSMFPEKQFYEFPYGLIAISVSDLANGSAVNITIELPENIPINSQFWEYGKTAANNTSRWYRIPFRNNNGDKAITVQLQDGGIGDDDGIENGIITTTGGPGVASIPGISGAVLDSITKTGIAGVQVSVSGGNSTISDSLGFYLLAVSEGDYNLIAKLDPTHYTNDTVQVSTIGQAVAAQDIELLKKPTGSITGNVRN